MIGFSVETPDGVYVYDQNRYSFDFIDGGSNLIVTDRVDRLTIASYRAQTGNRWATGEETAYRGIKPCPDPGCFMLVCADCGEHIAALP